MGSACTATAWSGPGVGGGDRLESLELEVLGLDLGMVALAAEEDGEGEDMEEAMETLEEETLVEEVLVGVGWVDWQGVLDLVGPVTEA